MKGFFPLASGSKGNAIYLETEEAKILIDAGISGRAIKNKLNEIGVALEDIDAILVTHDHFDHIQGLRVLAYRLGIPVLANNETAKGIVQTFHDCPKFKIFTTGEPFQFADMEINPFSVRHDTVDPVGFTIKTCGLKLGFCTDIGVVTSMVRHQLKECDYLYLEANHRPEMVHACSRPMSYKTRVLGSGGHLSNEECGALLCEIAHEHLKHVHLAHLSQECNSPEIALNTVSEILNKEGISLNISTAPQEKIGRAIHFDSLYPGCV